MGATIAGLLILGVFFTAALMLFRTTLFGNVIVDNAMKESTQIEGARARTTISIISTTADNVTGTLKVEVKNTGSTSVPNLSTGDVIVQFPEGNNNPQRLTYTESSLLSPGEWTATMTTTSDKHEPGIFNPGEVVTVSAVLSETGDATGTVTVSTPNGITDSASFRLTPSGFLVVDQDDELVYKYTATGTPDGSFALNGPQDAEGITTDGSSIWVVDDDDDRVYQYDMSGTSLGSFDLHNDNSRPRGIATDGSSIWVVDSQDDEVYKYDTSGTSLGSFNLISDNGNPDGVTTDGSSIWVVDRNDDQVYKYHPWGGGTALARFSLPAANDDFRGIATAGASIWVVERDDDIVYQYSMSGASLGSFALDNANGDPRGIAAIP